MTTLKPQLIRADTLDLQTQYSPSAKDHTRQPAQPSPVGVGPAAPHQNQTLRNAEHDALQEQMYGPGMSNDHDMNEYPDEPEFYDDQDDDALDGNRLRDRQAAGQPTDEPGVDDGEIADQGDDDGLDDDQMDRISSSPSIDDGMPRGHHHGKYPGSIAKSQIESSAGSTGSVVNTNFARFQKIEVDHDDYGDNLDFEDIDRHLVPLDDPLLHPGEEVEVDDYTGVELAEESNWEDEDNAESSESDSSSNDDRGQFSFTADSRFIDSGWGGECLREIEDIDFEFVYALHTFVATVEGQANATKGDTMVLLDDSNSYWWLVRVVKDGSIGYLPAEHIETPTERLARLNKHRNIDLSATMLGDNPEKSKNPLKKAMRRRNAKTVQFAAPQYFEPSDFDYSEDEEEPEEDLEQAENGFSSNGQDFSQEENAEADGLGDAGIKSDQNGQIVNGMQAFEGNEDSFAEKLNSPDGPRASDEVSLENYQEDANGRSRRGLVRNTDSFFKDDGAETKKISLTPRLLRGDSDFGLSSPQPDLKPQSSVDAFDKVVSPDSEKSNDDKKKKEKKGMLGGFFKRKDKRGKTQDPEIEDGKKGSDELLQASPPSKKSLESLTQEGRRVKGEKASQRPPTKLQKPPPPQTPAKASLSKDEFPTAEQSPPPNMESTISPSSQGSSSTPSTLRSPITEQHRTQENVSPRIASPEGRPERTVSPFEKKSIFTPLSDALTPATVQTTSHDLEGESSAAHAKQAENRFDVDDAEIEDDVAPLYERQQARHQPPTLATQSSERLRERVSESPIEVSPVDPPEGDQSSSALQPPTLMVDTSSSSERRSISPVSPTSTSSPSLVDADAATPNEADESTNASASSPHADTPTPSTTRSTPTWSDASLRTYMDNDDDIRDLLIIVHDHSNVVPAGPDHPITGNLFGAEKGRLAEMQSHLDSMLTNWLARKNQSRL